MLQVKNLSKQFGKNQAVKNVSFGVGAGEIFALVGPNGSGKTTIIEMIAGLLRPTGGEVVIDGHPASKDPVAAKKLLGYIPDEPSIWPGMTGGEFLRFSGALFGLDEKTITDRLPALFGLFGLAEIGGEYFEDYSRGNKQKFTILSALLHEPKLLLIDEPIVGLDPISAEIAQERFAEFARQGGAVLLVTHTLGVAEAIAQRIGFLEKGELKATGTLAELRQKAGLPAGSGLGEVYKALA